MPSQEGCASPAQAVRCCPPSSGVRSYPLVHMSGTQQLLARRRRETTMNVAARPTTSAAPMPPHAAAPAVAMAAMRSGPPQQAIGASSSHPSPFSLFSPLGSAVLEGTGNLAPRPGGVPTEARRAGSCRPSSICLIFIITLDFLVAGPRHMTASRTPDRSGAGDVLLLERHGTTTGHLRHYRSRARSSSGLYKDVVTTARSLPPEGTTLLGDALADAEGDDTGHEVGGGSGGEPHDTAHAPGGEALMDDEHPAEVRDPGGNGETPGSPGPTNPGRAAAGWRRHRARARP